MRFVSRPLQDPIVGESVKVHLPGEALWVICRSFDAARLRMVGEIDNYTVSSLHDYEFGDLVNFRWRQGGWEAIGNGEA